MRKTHISCYKNMRICIDGHSWMHQIAPLISYELFYNIPTDKHKKIFRNKVENLLSYKIQPVFVFDGDFFPPKKETAENRRKIKEKTKLQLKEALDRGETMRAKDLMKRVVDIKPSFFYDFLQELESLQIEYLIAPYEADPQMAYLKSEGYVDYIMTEDSDLIPYGGTAVLYKFNGTYVEEYNKNTLANVKSAFFAKNILDICILSGCDYLPSIKGVGLVTAAKKLEECGNLNAFVENFRLKKEIPLNYLENFYRAKKAFLHHIIYDPFQKKRIYLNSTEEEIEGIGSLENCCYVLKINENITVKINRHFIPGNEKEDPIKVNPISFNNSDLITDENTTVKINRHFIPGNEKEDPIEVNPISVNNSDLITDSISEIQIEKSEID